MEEARKNRKLGQVPNGVRAGGSGVLDPANHRMENDLWEVFDQPAGERIHGIPSAIHPPRTVFKRAWLVHLHARGAFGSNWPALGDSSFGCALLAWIVIAGLEVSVMGSLSKNLASR